MVNFPVTLTMAFLIPSEFWAQYVYIDQAIPVILKKRLVWMVKTEFGQLEFFRFPLTETYRKTSILSDI
jgi:hypothetical protein